MTPEPDQREDLRKFIHDLPGMNRNNSIILCDLLDKLRDDLDKALIHYATLVAKTDVPGRIAIDGAISVAVNTAIQSAVFAGYSRTELLKLLIRFVLDLKKGPDDE